MTYPLLRTPFCGTLKYASHLYGRTVEKVLGVGVTRKFLKDTGIDPLPGSVR